MIAKFWFRDVVIHFGMVLSLACLSVLPFNGQWQFAFPAIFLAAFFSFLVLVLFNYGPLFYAGFLPTLDTIIAERASIETVANETKKCKRSKFSLATLTIIFYVFAKTSKLPLPAANDKSAELLNRLYGADKDKLKQNLSRLYKIASLSPKERAEMLKGVDATRIFFEKVNFPSAQIWIDELERKLQEVV